MGFEPGTKITRGCNFNVYFCEFSNQKKIQTIFWNANSISIWNFQQNNTKLMRKKDWELVGFEPGTPFVWIDYWLLIFSFRFLQLPADVSLRCRTCRRSMTSFSAKRPSPSGCRISSTARRSWPSSSTPDRCQLTILIKYKKKGQNNVMNYSI